MNNTRTGRMDSTFVYDVEQLLKEGNIIKIHPQGYSMYPLFIPGRDEALIEQVPCQKLRRGDVVLYRRDHDILVIHRIYRIDDNGFYMVGDNQSEIEGPLRPDQIRGRMIGFIRNGKEYSIKHPFYRLFSGLWLILLPARPFCFRISAGIKKLFSHHSK